ncbi:MFS transporter [Candidatus Bathyarchaeota archaeon]|nr:MFS transporter [Candidatus Bathyarchaeota archaeon]MBL7078953.1 MFS transporter [Candidatus Bathyarchaeota archaeon]
MADSISILFALDLGANIFQVNLINTLRSTMSILLLVPFGILSDRYGRKPMIIYPRAIIFLGTVIRAFATSPNHLIIASLVGGFAGGSYFPILLSMIADISTPEERQEGISTLFLFSSIGMVLGPSLAASLLLLPRINMRNIYQITAVTQIGILIYLILTIKETKPPIERSEKTKSMPHIKQLVRQPSFQGLLIVGFLYNFYHSIFRTYAPIYGRLDLNLTDSEVVSFNSYRNLGVMLIRLSSATFLTRVPMTPFLISVLVLGGLTGFLAPLATNYISIVLILFLSGVSYGAFRIISTTLTANESVPENRGIANSLLDLSQSTGNMTKILTSSMAENLGFAPVFILGGVTCLSTIIPTLWRRLGRSTVPIPKS